jgi:hypothetical protein
MVCPQPSNCLVASSMGDKIPAYGSDCSSSDGEGNYKTISPCADGSIEICWDYEPEVCDHHPQGYRVYRTTTSPITTFESLCLTVGKDNVLNDKSSWNHDVQFLTGGGFPGKPFLSNRTFVGMDPVRSSIHLYRADIKLAYTSPPYDPYVATYGKYYLDPVREKEYIQVEASDRFDFKGGDFTIEMWVGNGERVIPGFEFPCQTVIACYDAGTDKRSWRLFAEPADVTESVSPGLSCRPAGATSGPICSTTDNSKSGTLVFEMFENGDGTGNKISTNIATLGYSITNWCMGWTGSLPMCGFFHVCIHREGNVLRFFIDGANVASVPITFDMAYDNQPVTIGRHFGNSGRIDPLQFSGPVPANDGDESYFLGAVCDVRICKGIALTPMKNIHFQRICNEPLWYDTFDEVAALPWNKKCWSDDDYPTEATDIYYRVAAVNCDNDVKSICPSYIHAVIESSGTFANPTVDTPADLALALAQTPPTFLDIFNTWDRANPYDQTHFTPANTPTGEHAAWYYDTTKASFVNPINTNDPVHIVSPMNTFVTEYKHECVVTSGETDDDTLGLVAAYVQDPLTGERWSLVIVRTHGGQAPFGGLGAYVIGPGYNGMGIAGGVLPSTSTGRCGMPLDQVSTNPTSRSQHTGCGITYAGTNGWSGKTTSIYVEREGNIITAYASPYGTSSMLERVHHRPSIPNWADPTREFGTYSPVSEIKIDFSNDAPPAGLSDWKVFMRPSGVGFFAHSQGDAFYSDWLYSPQIGTVIFDFTTGAPGEVWEWSNIMGGWYKTLDTVWEYVGKKSAKITDPPTGRVFNLDCNGALV